MKHIRNILTPETGRFASSGRRNFIARIAARKFFQSASCAVAMLAHFNVTSAHAQTPQADYLRRLSENVGGAGSNGGEGVAIPHLLAFVVLIAGVVTILIWWNNRQEKPKKIKHVNHSRKLMRQISREMGMAGDEIKQLKLLADLYERDKGQALENPLTLLLCPSLLTRSIESGESAIDRQVIGRLARRISQKPTKV